MTQPLITNYYLIGNVIRLYSAFVDILGAPVDPSTVVLSIKQPDGSVVTLTYANDQITKASTGNYYADFQPTIEGIHYYNYTGTGACVSASEKVFDVQPSAVL